MANMDNYHVVGMPAGGWDLQCGACGEKLEDNFITAFNMYWHPHHLGCKICGKDFSDGEPVQEGDDGFAYCVNDFKAVFFPHCSVCEEAIEGQMVSALNKEYHEKCFVCITCKEPFEAGNFFPGTDQNPYCETHFYAQQNLLCVDCQKPIMNGKAVAMGDLRYHPNHFNCTFCRKNLADSVFRKNKEKPYCKECFTRLFG